MQIRTLKITHCSAIGLLFPSQKGTVAKDPFVKNSLVDILCFTKEYFTLHMLLERRGNHTKKELE
jgi:hypothetical protein